MQQNGIERFGGEREPGQTERVERAGSRRRFAAGLRGARGTETRAIAGQVRKQIVDLQSCASDLSESA